MFYTGDWDMFFTDHPEAAMNAALRGVSGGPVYVSDKVGRTVSKWLRPLMNDEGWIKRCDSIGLPSPENLFTDPRKEGVLKVVNRRGGEILVGAFDLLRTGEKAAGSISFDDFAMFGMDVDLDCTYKVCGIFGGTCGTVSAREPFRFELESGGAEMFVLASEDA